MVAAELAGGGVVVSQHFCCFATCSTEKLVKFFHFLATQMGSELSGAPRFCSITSWSLISGNVMASGSALTFNKPVPLCDTHNMFLLRQTFVFPSRLPKE